MEKIIELTKTEFLQRRKAYKGFEKKKSDAMKKLRAENKVSRSEWNEVFSIAKKNFKEGYNAGLLPGPYDDGIYDFMLEQRNWDSKGYLSINNVTLEVHNNIEMVAIEFYCRGAKGDPDEYEYKYYSLRIIYDWENYKKELFNQYAQQQKDDKLEELERAREQYEKIQKELENE